MTTVRQKKKRNLFAGLSIMAILVVGLIAVMIFSPEEGDSEEEVNEGFKITNLSGDDFRKIAYTLKDKESVVFEYVDADKTWILSGEKEFPLAVESLKKQFIEKYIGAVAYDTVEEYKDLSMFGFDEPAATIEITDKDDKTHTYLIGDYNSTIDTYYMFYKEKNMLYTVGTDLLYICREDVYDFAGIDMFPSFSTDTLDYMVMKNGDKEVELVYMKDGYETDPMAGSSTWYILSPFTEYRACDAQNVTDNFEELFNGVGFSKKADYNATDEELKEYGLLDSDKYYEIIYRFEGEDKEQIQTKVKLVIGKLNEEKKSYYTRIIYTEGDKVEESRSINYMYQSQVETLLNIDPLDYIYPFVLYVPMKEINGGGIVIEKDDGTKYSVEYTADYDEKGAASNQVVKVNGNTVNTEKFQDFYYDFTKISINRPIYDRSTIVDTKPTYTFRYNREGEGTDDCYGDAVVEYCIYDATYYQVSINGEVDALATRREVDNVVKTLSELK